MGFISSERFLPLLVGIVLTGLLERDGTSCQKIPLTLLESGGQPIGAIFVVADGAPEWPRSQANKILEALAEQLLLSRPLRVAWFDAEPTLPHAFAVRDHHQELVRTIPRTSMRDTMELGFASLLDAPRPCAMIVIAREQFYPTSVPLGRLLELARQSATRIHTIHQASGSDQPHAPRQAMRSVGNGFLHIFERLVIGQWAYSPVETARQLKLMSDATGGCACVAEDEQAGIRCAVTTAARILNQEP